jgi:hypothetical protein
LPAGTAISITGTPLSGSLRGWRITNPENPEEEYGQVLVNGPFASYVTPAKDIKITPIIGPALAGLYAGFVTTAPPEEMTDQDLGKIRGYFVAGVMPEGASSCTLWVDGTRHGFRPVFNRIEGAKIDATVADKPEGVTVIYALKDGIADLAGLKMGDVIRSVTFDKGTSAERTIDLYTVRDFDAYVGSATTAGKKINLNIGIQTPTQVEIEPESEWYMRAMIELDTLGSGIWSGQINIKSDAMNGTRAFLNLQGVTLRNPARRSVQTSRANQIFSYAYTSVGNGKTQHPEHSAALYKGTRQVENLGQGGVFSVVTNPKTGTAMMYGRFGNGKQFTFNGIVGRLFAPIDGDDFLSAGALPSGTGQTSSLTEVITPQADMLEAVFSRSSNPMLPVFSLGDSNTDLNFIAGVVVFDREKLHGSVGMINRPIGSTGFNTEYIPNTLMGYQVSQDTLQSPPVWKDIKFLSSITFLPPSGFGSYEMMFFGTDQLSFQRKNPEPRVANVEGFRVETPVSALFKGIFSAPFLGKRTVHTFYGAAIGGAEVNAGVGFMLRGTTRQSYTELLGNKQNFSDGSTEAIRFDAP